MSNRYPNPKPSGGSGNRVPMPSAPQRDPAIRNGETPQPNPFDNSRWTTRPTPPAVDTGGMERDMNRGPGGGSPSK